jgi:outer membrane protein OmpA-like peptidoglycan-associated protein
MANSTSQFTLAFMAVVLTGCGWNLGSQSAGSPIPSQPRGLRPAPRWVGEGMTRAARDLYFDVNSHYLRPRERRKLAQIAPALQDILHDFPDLIIVIEGYSDDYGEPEYNEGLARERAETVRQALRNLSFPEEHLRTASVGFRSPQCITPDDVCQQKNRRVHFRAAQEWSDAAVAK